jgi:hypothetical protein
MQSFEELLKRFELIKKKIHRRGEVFSPGINLNEASPASTLANQDLASLFVPPNISGANLSEAGLERRS